MSINAYFNLKFSHSGTKWGNREFMIKKYTYELDGQIDFYTTYLSRIDNSLATEDIFQDNNDGILNGNIVEFKLNINDLNSVLFQTIKYLSQRRIKGKPIPSNIVLISLNEGIAYLYKSEDYIKNIEQVYNGSASKDNTGFVANNYNEKLYYIENQLDEDRLIHILKEKSYTKIHIDENCIVGWAERFYRENPNAKKGDFIGDLTGKVKIIGEIRKPDKFKDYIYPYSGKSNKKFEYLMDKLNDAIQKKNLGAFYTPLPYAQKSIELLRIAITRVPKNNDYIILDRCAGTGNLEKLLTGEELSHVIVSTVEYYEYKVLMEVLGDKVRHIIPPAEKEDTFNMGLVRGADALSEDYINNPLLRKYIDNPKCTIILFENPPYAETTGIEHQRKKQSKTSSIWKKSYILQKMKKEIKGSATNDLGNAFIWSGFKYFLRQDTDSYIVYSPVKYWKAQHLIHKEFIDGFAFNRKHFHTNIDACISCILWSNKENKTLNEFEIEGFDIQDDNSLKSYGFLPIKSINKKYSELYYDKRSFSNDTKTGILVGLDGTEKIGGKQRNKPLSNDNIIGYLIANTSGFDNPDLNGGLLIAARYDGNGFHLRKDNYLEKLPMYCASRYITYNRQWTERARIMKSADGASKFFSDIKNGKLNQYLLKCLLFTCMEMQNHIRSFIGSNGKLYRNELCFDTTNGETIASKDIKCLIKDEMETKIINQWMLILNYAKMTKNYDSKLTYGLYQIWAELNTYHKDIEQDINIYDYPELNGNIKVLKQMIKEYYNNQIAPILFKYEFLK